MKRFMQTHRAWFTAAGRILRWVISIALLLVLFRMVDLGALQTTLNDTRWWLVLAAFLLLSADRIAYALRWKLILQPYTPWVRLGTLARITYISTFLANFLPSALSADLVRGYFLRQEKADLDEVVSSVTLDRVIGFGSQLLLALIALAAAYLQGFLPSGWLWIVLLLLGLTALGCGLIATSWFGSLVARLQASRWRLVRRAGQMVKTIRSYPWTAARLIRVLGFACLAYIPAIFGSYLLFLAVGGSLPFSFFFLFILIVQIAILIPVSIGGFGVHEGAWVVVMGTAGVPPADALGYALLAHAVGLIVSLPGGMLYAVHRPQLAGRNARALPQGSHSLPPEEILDLS